VKDIDESKTKNPKSSLVLFYQYTEKTKKWSPDKVKILMTYLSTIAKKRNIGGRIRVAQEGVNATLSAVDMPTKNGISASEALRHVIQDLKNFDPVFEETDFKYIDDLPADRHFKELRVIPVEELVFYGIREEDAACDEGGVHLDAIEYRKLIEMVNDLCFCCCCCLISIV
jgi:predicted sulfurtransferase